jgi:hypothetical protein
MKWQTFDVGIAAIMWLAVLTIIREGRSRVPMSKTERLEPSARSVRALQPRVAALEARKWRRIRAVLRSLLPKRGIGSARLAGCSDPMLQNG